MKIYRRPEYTYRGTHYITMLKRKILTCAEGLLYGTAIAALVLDGSFIFLEEPTIGNIVRTNLDHSNKLNDKTIKQ